MRSRVRNAGSFAAVSACAAALFCAATASAEETILPGALDLPVVAGSRLASGCSLSEEYAASQSACVTLSRSDSSGLQRAYVEALQSRGWRGASGAANMIAFEQPIEGGECSRRLSFIGMPHGSREQIEALREGRLRFEDFDTHEFWFVLASQPVCGDARQARASQTTQQRPERTEPTAAYVPFAPAGRDGEGVILPDRVGLPVMAGSFLADNCHPNPELPRLMRMARLSVQCVATSRLTDGRWDDRYHEALLERGWRLRQHEGSVREYTRRVRPGCAQNLGMSGNVIVDPPSARQGRRILDRSAVTHQTLIFILDPLPGCAREAEEE